MAVNQQQLQQDVQFLQPFIDNGTAFTIVHQARLRDILQRCAQLGRRRGGPTRQMLLALPPLLPGQANFQAADNKATIIAGLLQMVAQLLPAQNQPNGVQVPAINNGAGANNNAVVANVAGVNNNVQVGNNNAAAQAPNAQPAAAQRIPAGWEHFFSDACWWPAGGHHHGIAEAY